jgi:hypothetical protein
MDMTIDLENTTQIQNFINTSFEYAKEEMNNTIDNGTIFSPPKKVFSWGITEFEMFGVSMDLVILHEEIMKENTFVKN